MRETCCCRFAVAVSCLLCVIPREEKKKRRAHAKPQRRKGKQRDGNSNSRAEVRQKKTSPHLGVGANEINYPHTVKISISGFSAQKPRK